MIDVFIAGTPRGPLFSLTSNPAKTIVFTDHRIFHHKKRTSKALIIWKAKQRGMRHGLTMEINDPSSLKWVKHKEEPSTQIELGTSWLMLASLREAVRLNVEKHPPKTPEEANDLALLKAASYWCWDQPKSLVSVDYDQIFEKAARFALDHWQKELSRLKQGAAEQQDQSGFSSDESDEEAETGILEDIISIRLFLDTDPNKKGTVEQKTKMMTRAAAAQLAKATFSTQGEKSSNKRDFCRMNGNVGLHATEFVTNKQRALAQSS